MMAGPHACVIVSRPLLLLQGRRLLFTSLSFSHTAGTDTKAKPETTGCIATRAFCGGGDSHPVDSPAVLAYQPSEPGRLTFGTHLSFRDPWGLSWCCHAGVSPAAVLLHAENILTTATTPSFFLLPLAPVPLVRIEAHSLHFLLRVVTTWNAAVRASAFASSLVFVPFYLPGLCSPVTGQGTGVPCRMISPSATAHPVSGFYPAGDTLSAQSPRPSSPLVSHFPASDIGQPGLDRGRSGVAAGSLKGTRQQQAAAGPAPGASVLPPRLPSVPMAGNFSEAGAAGPSRDAVRAFSCTPKACFLSTSSWSTVCASGWYVYAGCRPGAIGCGFCGLDSGSRGDDIREEDESAFSDSLGGLPARVPPQAGEFTDVGGLSQSTMARLFKSREKNAIDGLLGTGTGPDSCRSGGDLFSRRSVFWCEWRRQPHGSRAGAEEAVRLFRIAAGQPCCKLRPVICPLTLWIYRHPTDCIPLAVCHALALGAERRCSCHSPSDARDDAGTTATVPAAYCNRSSRSLLSVVVTCPAPDLFSRVAMRPLLSRGERRFNVKVGSRRRVAHREVVGFLQSGRQSAPRGVRYRSDQSPPRHMASSATPLTSRLGRDTGSAERFSSYEHGPDGALEGSAVRGTRLRPHLFTRETLAAGRDYGVHQGTRRTNGYEAALGARIDRPPGLWTWTFEVASNREWQLVTASCCTRGCGGSGIASRTCTGCCARSRVPSSPSRLVSGLSDSSVISSLPGSFDPRQTCLTCQEQRHLSLRARDRQEESLGNRLSITQGSGFGGRSVRSPPATVRRTSARRATPSSKSEEATTGLSATSCWKCGASARGPTSRRPLQSRTTGQPGLDAGENGQGVPSEPNLLPSPTPRLSRCSTPRQGPSGGSFSSVSAAAAVDLERGGKVSAAVPCDRPSAAKGRLSGAQAHLRGASIKLLVDRLAVQLLPPSSPLPALVNLYPPEDIVLRALHHHGKCASPLGQQAHGRDSDQGEVARQSYMGQLYGKLHKQQEKWRQQQLQRGAVVLTLVGIAGSVVVSPLLDPMSCVDFVLKNAVLENSHVIPQSRRRIVLQGSLRAPSAPAGSGGVGRRQPVHFYEDGEAVSRSYQEAYDICSREVAVIRGKSVQLSRWSSVLWGV